MRIPATLALIVLFAVSCSPPAAIPPSPATPITDGNAIKAHIQKLASDEMEGRAPGGKGEELATTYIADFFKSIGLQTKFQPVPLIGITSTPSPLKLTGKDGAKTLKFGDDFVAWSKREQGTISTDAELV